jgi:serine/threonine protein kinase
MSIAPGDRLGPFEIRARLGEGAMGHVFRARDTRLGRDVAVKVMVPGLASDPAAVARFETEARAVAALSHPNIVALYDVGRYEDTAYVVTELIEGETLRDRLSAGQVPARKAADYGRQIATALAAAHDRGIVHRDLKPENVFLTPDRRIKVLDFGVAQMTSSLPPSETATVASDPASAAVVGSIGYMAPEQVRGGPVDHRADIFALGCVLYELVSRATRLPTRWRRSSMPILRRCQRPRPLGHHTSIASCGGASRSLRTSAFSRPATWPLRLKTIHRTWRITSSGARRGRPGSLPAAHWRSPPSPSCCSRSRAGRNMRRPGRHWCGLAFRPR